METTNYEFAAVLLLVRSLLLLGLFIAASSACFLAMRGMVRSQSSRDLIWSLSLVLGPALMSWLMVHLLYHLPGRPVSFYLLTLTAVFVLPGLYGLWAFVSTPVQSLWRLYRDLSQTPLRLVLCVGLALGTLTTIGHLIGHQLVIPLWANDPLEYAHVSRVMAELRSVRDYPFTDPALTGGLQAAWTHPLGFPGLMITGYFVQGSTEFSGIVRMITPWLLFANVCILGLVAGHRRPVAGFAAALMLATTPYVFHLASQSHIDILRLAAFTACFASIWHLARQPNFGAAIVAALCTAAVHFTHSIGLITLPLIIPLYLLISQASWQVTWRNIAIFSSLSIAAVSLRIGINLAEFGSILKDGPIAWSYDHLRVQEQREVVRLLYTTYDKIVRGVLAGWTRLELFGIAHWVATAALGFMLWVHRAYLVEPVRGWRERVWRSDDPIFAAVILAGGFYCFVFLTMALGSDLVIKNARYLLTVQPFIILVAARVLAMPLDAGSGLKLATKPAEDTSATREGDA